MNWKEIETRYALAFEVFNNDFAGCEVYSREPRFIRDEPKSDGEELFKFRDLYDFFDSQGIMVEVGVDYTRQGYGNPLYVYRINIFHSEDDISNWSDLCRSRSEAEENAFALGFKILNDKLNNYE